MQPVVRRPPFVKIIVPISELWSSQCMVSRPAFAYQCESSKSTNPQNLRCLVENLRWLLFPGFRTTKNSRQPTLLPLQKTSGCSQKKYETQTRGFPLMFIFYLTDVGLLLGRHGCGGGGRYYWTFSSISASTYFLYWHTSTSRAKSRTVLDLITYHWVLILSLEKSLFQNRSIISALTSLVLWPMDVALQKVSDEVKQKNVPASALN